MRYVRILLLAVVGMVPAMRFGFSAQVKPEYPDEFGRSPAATREDEGIRAALRAAARSGEAGEVATLLAGLPNDAERARCIGLFDPNEINPQGQQLKVTAWLSAANRLSFNALQLFVPYLNLNQNAKDYALQQAAAPEPKADAGQIAQQAIFRLLLDALALTEKRRHTPGICRLTQLKEMMLQQKDVTPNAFVLPWPNNKMLLTLWIGMTCLRLWV
jgi:hypothetical protein